MRLPNCGPRPHTSQTFAIGTHVHSGSPERKYHFSRCIPHRQRAPAFAVRTAVPVIRYPRPSTGPAMARIARIRVLETLTEGRYQTYRVLDPAENVTLLAHYGDLSLLEVADKLGPDVLERGDSGGFAYFLTPDKPELRNLNVSLAKPQAPKPEPAPATPPAAEPGEFTRMFRIPSAAASPPPPPAPAAPAPAAATPVQPAAPPPAAPPASPPASSSDFGFTGMFSSMSKISAEPAAPKSAPAPASQPKQPQPTPPAPPVAPPSAPSSSPGQFTAMFQTPNLTSAPAKNAAPVTPPPAQVPPPPAPPAASGSPSEFTQFFSGAPPQRPEAEQPQRARPVDASEFTRMFSAMGPAPIAPPAPASPQPPPPPAAAARPEAPPSSFQSAPFPPSSPAPPPPQPYPEPPRSSGPGEFTRMFQAKPKPAGEVELPPKPPMHGGGGDDDGDFTRFFNNPLSSSREPDWKAVERQPAPAPTARPQGDFTRMFGKADMPGAAAKPPSAAPAATGGAGGTTDLFSKPKPAAQPAPSAAPKDDDFAKKFGAPKVEAPKVPELPGAVPVQMPPKKAPLLLLIIIVVALVIIGACLIYYFVFRK